MLVIFYGIKLFCILKMFTESARSPIQSISRYVDLCVVVDVLSVLANQPTVHGR